MTSPSYNSSIEVRNYITEVCLAGHEEEPEWQSDLVDFGHELKSAVDSMLQAYPKYIGFIV